MDPLSSTLMDPATFEREPPPPSSTAAKIPAGLFPKAVQALRPYVPGLSVAEIMRRSGLDEVAKLASNECPLGPTLSALEAIRNAAPSSGRYPDGAARQLRSALAEHHMVVAEQIAVGAGADGCIDSLIGATIEHGDELICGWPSFPTPVITASRLGASVTRVPLRPDHVHDLDAMLDAIGSRTKLVFICHPNNPTGTANTRAELNAYFDAVPDHVLTVLDQAYREYVDESWYPDGIEYLHGGRRVAVLRTFSKIHGLADLRIGYMLAPQAVVAAVLKVQRAFEIGTIGQAAAEASLTEITELGHRKVLNRLGRSALIDMLTRVGFTPELGPVANFVYVKPEADPIRLASDLLGYGVAIRTLAGFGCSNGIRISVGTSRDHEQLEAALAQTTGFSGAPTNAER